MEHLKKEIKEIDIIKKELSIYFKDTKTPIKERYHQSRKFYKDSSDNWNLVISKEKVYYGNVLLYFNGDWSEAYLTEKPKRWVVYASHGVRKFLGFPTITRDANNNYYEYVNSDGILTTNLLQNKGYQYLNQSQFNRFIRYKKTENIVYNNIGREKYYKVTTHENEELIVSGRGILRENIIQSFFNLTKNRIIENVNFNSYTMNIDTIDIPTMEEINKCLDINTESRLKPT